MQKAVFRIAFIVLFVFCLIVPVQASGQSDVDMDIFEEILKQVEYLHVDNPDEAILLNGAIKGMLESLEDPYTQYLSPNELGDFYSYMDNQYVGVGIKLRMGEHYPEIVEVIKDSPADKAGIKADDQIVKVDGDMVADQPLEYIEIKLRGLENTKVNITIKRSGVEDFDLELVRADIKVQSLFYKVLDNDIGYVRLDHFANGSGFEFNKALTDLKRQGITALIVDLRGNPGGSIGEAVQVISAFVNPGQLVAYSLDSRGNREMYHSAGIPVGLRLPTVLLLDQNSASASEFVAGALQDYQAATIVGRQTYGKGSMQSLIPLHNGGALKVTIAKYFTPHNRIVHGIGIDPDYQVLTPELQLAAAQRLLQAPVENMVTFNLDNTELMVNDIPATVDQKVLQEAGCTYLPLRIAFEALGYKVDWLTTDSSVRISGFGYDVFLSPEKKQDSKIQLYAAEDVLYIALTDLSYFGVTYETVGNSITIKK